MHIFHKRKELPLDRGRRGGGEIGGCKEEGRGKGRTPLSAARPPAHPRICMHAGSSGREGCSDDDEQERRKIGLFVSDLRIWHEKSDPGERGEGA